MLGLIQELSDENQSHAPFFGYMGIVAAIGLSNLGAAYGTAKAGVGMVSMTVLRPEKMFNGVIPIVMAGILGIYGLITAVIFKGTLGRNKENYATQYGLLGAGLCVGIASLGAGLAIGIVGDAGVRAMAQQDKIFIGLLLIMIFAEALALYGFIVGLILGSAS